MDELQVSKVDFLKYTLQNLDFLERIHPFVKKNGYSPEKFEIRHIGRGHKEGINLAFSLWTLPQDNREKIVSEVYNDMLKGKKPEKDFLPIYYYLTKMKDQIGEPFCSYYSLFSSKGSSKYTQLNNAYRTHVLPMDFDNINQSSFLEIRKSLVDIGLEPTIVFTGHGYQCLLHLEEPTMDTDIFKKFTTLLTKKGFPVDTKIVDSARIFRLPNTYNCKKYSPRYSKYKDEAVPFNRIIHLSKKDYPLSYIFNQLESLDDVITKNSFAEVVNNILFDESTDKDYIEKVILTHGSEALGKEVYSQFFNCDALPKNMWKMLLKGVSGSRHDIALYLIPYFKNVLELDNKSLLHVFRIWNSTFCDESLDSIEFEAFIKRLYKSVKKGMQFGQLNKTMISLYGYPEAINNEYLLNQGNTQVSIPFNVFRMFAYQGFWDADSKEKSESKWEDKGILSASAFSVYCLIKVKTTKDCSSGFEDYNCFTKQEFLENTDFSLTSLDRHFNELIECGLIYKGAKGVYSLALNETIDNEVFTVDINLIENALLRKHNSLSYSEFRVFMFIKFKIYYETHSVKEGTNLWLSNEQLGNYLSLTRTAILKLIHSIAEKKYITIGYKIASNKSQVTYLTVLH